jgi:hypothetical protein
MALKRSVRPASDSPFSIPLGPALLYLDDIRDVYDDLATFSQQWRVSNQKSMQGNGGGASNSQDPIEIRAQNAAADSVEDLKDATRQELNEVSLICKSPKIGIDFWLRGAEIIAESDNADVRSYAESLQKFVQARRNWLMILPAIRKGFLVAISALLAYVVIAILAPVPSQIKIYPSPFLISGESALVALLIFVVYRTFRYTVRVAPTWRRENSGLSRKMRRDLAIALGSAIVAGVLGLWAGLFAHSDGSHPAASQSVVQPEWCGLTKAADGNAGPVTCPDGSVNLAAVQYFNRMNLRVLKLGPKASSADITAAICQDVTARHTTIPVELSAVELVAAGERWHYAMPSSKDMLGIVAHCRSSKASPNPS